MSNSFELITDDELLYQMCQDWDNLTLNRMSQAYSRVYNVCRNEIERRKKEKDDEILKIIRESKLGAIYRKNFDNKAISKVDIYFLVDDGLKGGKITQTIIPYEASQFIPRISDKLSFFDSKEKRGFGEFHIPGKTQRVYEFYLNSFEEVKKVISNLIDQKYI